MSFKDLVIWQESFSLANDIFELCKKDSLSKEFRIKDQLKGCSSSIPALIAEGSGKSSKTDFARMCCLARGELFELCTFLELCRKQRMISEVDFREFDLDARTELLGKRINCFISKLREGGK